MEDKTPAPCGTDRRSMTDSEFELSRLKEALDHALDEQAVSAERNARRVADATISVAVATVKATR
jgi:hypothetical protein